MDSLIGRALGAYRITEQLGQGGMATVYKAYHPTLDRYVAVKVLPEYFAHEPSFFERFMQEAQAVARLRHPNILQVFDFGREGSIAFLVMEYVEGGTLQQRMLAVCGSGLAQGLPMSEIVRLTRQVADALAYAHACGVIHRDVKPSNILLSKDGNAVLSDFGIARMAERVVNLTKTGVGVGTPEYMAPEQGQGLPCDGRSDIYALGVVLYEMATGRVPYAAQTPLAVVLKHMNEAAPPPRSLNPAIPQAVERIIMTCMAKNPAERYQTAADLVQALDAALAGAPPATLAEVRQTLPLQAAQAAPRYTPLPQAAPQAYTPLPQSTPAYSPPLQASGPAAGAAASRPAPLIYVLAIIGALAILALAVLAGATLRDRVGAPAPAPSPTASTAGLVALPASPTTAAAAPATATLQPLAQTPATAAAATAASPSSAPATATLQQLAQTPATATAAAATSPSSAPATATLRPLALTATIAPAAATPPTATPAAAPATTTPAAAAPPTATRAATAPPTAAATATPTPTAAPTNTAAPAAFSGRIVYTHYRGPSRYGDFDVMVLDVPGGTPRKIADRGSEPAFSPDGRRILYYSWNNSGFYIMNPDGSGQQRISSSTEDSYPAWSKDGRRIAFSLFENRYNIWLMNADGSGRVKIIDGGEQPSWSPDGSRIVYKGCLGSSCGLMMANADGGAKRLITDNANDSSPAWSPGGGYILFTTNRSGNLDVWIMRSDGSGMQQLTFNPTSDGAASWSPDGNYIFFRSDRDGSWGIYQMTDSGGGQRKIVAANCSERWWWERVSVGW